MVAKNSFFCKYKEVLMPMGNRPMPNWEPTRAGRIRRVRGMLLVSAKPTSRGMVVIRELTPPMNWHRTKGVSMATI